MIYNKNRGFTLIELLVVITIISLLLVAGVVSYTSVNKRSRDARRKSDMEQMRSALEMYRSDNGVYPGTVEGFVTFADLDSGGGTGPLVTTYLPAMPTDPKSTASSPIYYYYTPIKGGGTKVYDYCICATLESETGSTSCAVSAPAVCNYVLKNP